MRDFGRPYFCVTARAITVLILLAEVTATPAGRVLAMAYGILSALALPLETIMLPLIAQDLFQGPQYNKMLGIIVSVNTAGYAVGTPIANLTFDCLGTYQPCCWPPHASWPASRSHPAAS